MRVSIDTIQINTKAEINTDEIAIHETTTKNRKSELYSYIFNINKLSDDNNQITSYTEYRKHKTTLMTRLNLEDSKTVRIDFAFDNFDKDSHKELFLKHKLLIMLLSNKYETRNVYTAVNEWSLDKISTNLKSQYLDVENYEKSAQENKSADESNIENRLEFRIKKVYVTDGEDAEVVAFNRLETYLTKSTSHSNFEELETKMFEILLRKISEQDGINKPDTVLSMYSDSIFTKQMLVNIYLACGYKNPKRKAERFIKQKKLNLISYDDINRYACDLIAQGKDYFSTNLSQIVVTKNLDKLDSYVG